MKRELMISIFHANIYLGQGGIFLQTRRSSRFVADERRSATRSDDPT